MPKIPVEKMLHYLDTTKKGYCGDCGSLIYGYIEDWVKSHDLPLEETCFLEEFTCFETDYIVYYLDMIKRNIPCKKILDIGCANGFQSIIFDGYEYTGIEKSERITPYEEDGAKIINEDFLETDFDLSDYIVISNMSLGYFLDEGKTREQLNDEIAHKLSKCKYLYISTVDEIVELLKPHFAECITLQDTEVLGSHFKLTYLHK